MATLVRAFLAAVLLPIAVSLSLSTPMMRLHRGQLLFVSGLIALVGF